MKSKIKKFAALTVSAGVIMSLSSCTSKAASGYIEADGNKITPEYVMIINGDQVSFDEYRYYYLNVKESYDYGDESYWDDNADKAELVKTETESYIRDMYAVKKLAADNGLTLDSDDKSAVENQINDAVKTYGDEQFTEQLEQSYMTEELYRQSLENRVLSNKLYDYYFNEPGEYAWTDAEYRDYLNDNYYCAMHILINYVSGEGTITYDQTAALANEVYEKAVSGSDFWELILEYGCDANMEKNENGYFITEGDMSDEFYSVVKKLDEGMISRPLQTANGFYIIKRLPFTEEGITNEKEYVMNGYQDDSGDWHSGVYDKKFTEIYTAAAENLTVEYCSDYSLITPQSMK